MLPVLPVLPMPIDVVSIFSAHCTPFARTPSRQMHSTPGVVGTFAAVRFCVPSQHNGSRCKVDKCTTITLCSDNGHPDATTFYHFSHWINNKFHIVHDKKKYIYYNNNNNNKNRVKTEWKFVWEWNRSHSQDNGAATVVLWRFQWTTEWRWRRVDVVIFPITISPTPANLTQFDWQTETHIYWAKTNL